MAGVVWANLISFELHPQIPKNYNGAHIRGIRRLILEWSFNWRVELVCIAEQYTPRKELTLQRHVQLLLGAPPSCHFKLAWMLLNSFCLGCGTQIGRTPIWLIKCANTKGSMDWRLIIFISLLDVLLWQCCIGYLSTVGNELISQVPKCRQLSTIFLCQSSVGCYSQSPRSGVLVWDSFSSVFPVVCQCKLLRTVFPVALHCGMPQISFSSGVPVLIGVTEWYPSVKWVDQWLSSGIAVHNWPANVQWLRVREVITESILSVHRPIYSPLCLNQLTPQLGLSYCWQTFSLWIQCFCELSCITTVIYIYHRMLLF